MDLMGFDETDGAYVELIGFTGGSDMEYMWI